MIERALPPRIGFELVRTPTGSGAIFATNSKFQAGSALIGTGGA
jgi:hypothetical protein